MSKLKQAPHIEILKRKIFCLFSIFPLQILLSSRALNFAKNECYACVCMCIHMHVYGATHHIVCVVVKGQPAMSAFTFHLI